MKEQARTNAPKVLKQIQFSVMSPQQMERLSEVEITKRELYQIGGGANPVPHGAVDRRLGVSDKFNVCETCGLKMVDCMGHYGHINLVLPVFHVGYFKACIYILQCICKNPECGRVLLSEKERRENLARIRNPRQDEMAREAQRKRLNKTCKTIGICPHCGEINGVVKKVGPLKVIHDKYRKKNTHNERDVERGTFQFAMDANSEIKQHINKAMDDLNPLKVFQLFERISAEDCELLGLSPEHGRPETLLWRTVPVPPVCIRPSVNGDNGISEDDLTGKLTEIIYVNALLADRLATIQGASGGGTVSDFYEKWEYMQHIVAMYINSDVPALPGMNEKPIKGFCQRLKGKQGRFRGNLSGKRVNFSGRTVISPDPNLRIDEVALPILVASNLTYPERVFAGNIERLRKAVINGPEVYPGAKFIVNTSTKFKRSLQFCDRNQAALGLRIGDVVERHLIAGDVVLFNRQPSLHRLSIMAMFVRVHQGRTFRFNECVCAPFNADYDGDEMNIHVPQTEEAKAEAIQLMGVKNNLVSPRLGELTIAATQDFITASYMITKKDRMFNRSEFTQVVSYFFDASVHVEIPPPTILKPMQLWTGKQVFSVLFKPNSVTQILINHEGKNQSLMDVDGLPRKDLSPSDQWFVMHNSDIMCGVMDKKIVGDGTGSIFSVILRDHGSEQAALAMSRLAKMCAKWLAHRGITIGIDDVRPTDVIRKEMRKVINKGYADTEQFIKTFEAGKLERLPGMNEEETLEKKIMGTLSKVREDGSKLCRKYLSPHNMPIMMAWCGSKGSMVNISQMIAVVAQQSISNKRIPEGFANRTLPHYPPYSKSALAKGFVENSFFLGLAPPEFFCHAVSGREGLIDTAVKTAETGYMQRRLMKALEDLVVQYDVTVRSSNGDVIQFMYGDDGLDPTELEGTKLVDFDRALSHVRSVAVPPASVRRLLPCEIEVLIDKALKAERFIKFCTQAFRDAVLSFVKKSVVGKLAKARVSFGLRAATLQDLGCSADDVAGNSDADLAAKFSHIDDMANADALRTVRNLYGLTRAQILEFLRLLLFKHMRTRIDAGTAVGALAAQSIGEPSTQMTLRTFHFTGLAVNVTAGVPRIKEIINAAKSIAVPLTRCVLANPRSTVAARIAQGRIQKTLLSEVAAYVDEVYRSNEAYLLIRLDLEAIRQLHLEVDTASIVKAIKSAPKLKVSAGNIVPVRDNLIRIYVISKDPNQMHQALKNMRRQILDVPICGIPSVSRALLSENEKTEGEYYLSAIGNGFRDIINTNGVVASQSISTHIMEVVKVLGVEAARALISNEIHETIKGTAVVNSRHLGLLADMMTYKGEVLGITRFGIAKMKDSVLMLASFEKTTDHLFDAAVYGKRDSIEGVSECIIMGRHTPIGTGLFNLIQMADRVKLPARHLLFDTPSMHVPLVF
ncbi:beta and beta-prime subunits of DNA dependent RNA-polymerase [Ramicandelaber brevisporus]|nr:beta and beta-prime subunits of DNA dependent RNA-polymerase [Ramicandelaber brevisporus]